MPRTSSQVTTSDCPTAEVQLARRRDRKCKRDARCAAGYHRPTIFTMSSASQEGTHVLALPWRVPGSWPQTGFWDVFGVTPNVI
jgi:hypothetical protein